MLTNENNVAIAYTVTGTHQGDFMGGRQPANASACGVQIARFENGRSSHAGAVGTSSVKATQRDPAATE